MFAGITSLYEILTNFTNVCRSTSPTTKTKRTAVTQATNCNAGWRKGTYLFWHHCRS